MSRRDTYAPVAKSVFYDNTTSGLAATDTQDAIDQAYASAANASRGAIICGFDGTGSSGRWLEFFSNNPSNNNPFIVSEDAELIAISISASTNSTGTVGVFRNGSNIQALSLTASRKGAIDGLALPLDALDEISVQVTAGSIARPTFFLFIRTLASATVGGTPPPLDIDGGTF